MKIKNVIKLLILVALLGAAGSWYYFEVYRKQPITIEEDEGIPCTANEDWKRDLVMLRYDQSVFLRG